MLLRTSTRRRAIFDQIALVRYDHRFGVWRSPVAHLLWEQGVQGSNPCTPTKIESLLVKFLQQAFLFYAGTSLRWRRISADVCIFAASDEGVESNRY